MELVTKAQYEDLFPINEKYGKWLDDKISMRYIYQPFLEFFENVYYHAYKRDEKWQIISEKLGRNQEAMLALIKNKSVILTNSTTCDRFELSFKDGLYFLDEKPYSKNEIRAKILNEKAENDNWKTDVVMLVENVENNLLSQSECVRVYMLNETGNDPEMGDIFFIKKPTDDFGESATQKHGKSSVINVKKIESELAKLCHYTPQLEFFAIDLIPTTESFKIIKMHENPPYPQEGFSAKINNHLINRLKNFTQPAATSNQQKLERRNYTETFYPKGFYPYLESSLKLKTIPNFANEVTESTWASARGFLPSRIEQYGIEGSNHKNFISDFEYEYLGHINNKYRIWFEDKITIKYLLRNFNECLPEYYYLIANKNGENRIISLMDCPEKYGIDYENIFELVREKKTLALKPDEGTHGAGFLKFSYRDKKYFINEKITPKSNIIEILQNTNNQYLVTEFIKQHSNLAKIYPGSVNTARLTVFKKDGENAVIGNGYLRFGNSKTKGVDNVGAGGISADLDIATGYFKNGVCIGEDGQIKSCSQHPDTGVSITGYLPNWNYATKMVLKIATAIPEIEYMGFDVAFTENGIKLPEINRFPDYPKLNKLTPETTDYLLQKLAIKSKKYGYKITQKI